MEDRECALGFGVSGSSRFERARPAVKTLPSNLER